jgi:hypothetical protein
VPRSFFGKYNFESDVQLEFSPYITNLAGSPIFTSKAPQNYPYEPRVYPLFELWDIAPESVVKTIGLLEEFPDANNKPIFDHFGVIVPGIGLSYQQNKGYVFLDENGMAQIFPVREMALKALDKIMIKGKYLYPIIIGEKDGKCYFICFFA